MRARAEWLLPFPLNTSKPMNGRAAPGPNGGRHHQVGRELPKDEEKEAAMKQQPPYLLRANIECEARIGSGEKGRHRQNRSKDEKVPKVDKRSNEKSKNKKRKEPKQRRQKIEDTDRNEV